MLDNIGEPAAVALAGLLGGILLGLAARLGRFCTLGAIEDALYANDTLRLRMWGVAIGVAIIGTFSAATFGWVPTERTLYLAIAWNPAASIIGGLLFGYGMALAGNCGFGALARFGGGDLRSFVIVLVMGLASFAALSGPLARLRITLFPTSPATETVPGFAHLLGDFLGLPAIFPAIGIGLVFIATALASRQIRCNPMIVFWGTVVGFAIVTGWVGTSLVASHGFAPLPVVSHTFSRPLGETMLYVMTSSGRSLSFGVGSVAGVVVGAFIGSLIKGHFRWEACEDPRELKRQITGAAMMGVGAVVALGCTVGQGLSAFSVLAFSAPVTMVAIFAGASIGLRQLISGFMPAE
ncbi:MAG: YeeE/YedE family protein [Silicimonas sp.]|nr:YeeE/YedE family protein [Silicimonas sp.]